MKKIFSALLASVLAAGTMVLPTAAADGDIVYLQTFDNVASYDDLGWEIVETLTTNTSTYTIENGALTVDNLGGNDSYTVVVPASVMDEVNKGDYTVGYDFTLLESGDTARYLAMLLNYDREVGNTYNSLHMRMKGYADWQNRFVGTWSANMDTNGGYQGLPLFTAKDDGAISNRLFGLAYTDASNVIAGKTIRYEMRVSNSGGYVEVYMNGQLISGTDEAGWDQFTWASEDYSEICLKSGGSILGTVDNIVVVQGLGIPEGTLPAMAGADAPAAEAPAAEAAPAAGLPAAYPCSGTAVPDGSVLIAGDLIGSENGWDGTAGSGRASAFDGNIETFFDPATASVDYCGIDAGEEMILTKIMIHPRTTFLDRFNGATIEASNDPEFEDSVELFFSVEQAAEIAFVDCTPEMEESENTGYRYFRYINYMSHGDVAEVELYGKAKDGTNPVYGAAAATEAPAAEAPAAAAPAEFTTYTEYPETTGTELVYATGDMDMLSGYDAKGGIGVDLFNLASGGTAYCLKRDTSAWYDFEVSEKTDVTFYVGYIARDGSNRGLDWAIDDPNGANRIFMDLPESAEQQWVSATFTVDAGKHTFYLYAPTGMDDSTLKSCDVYTIELYGTPAAGGAAEAPAVEEVPAVEAEPTIFANATVVEVSGLETEGANTGDMAIDGDMATRWSSNTDDAAHIIVDLGAVTPVDSLDIYWETACAADYTVEVSEDNANWTVVATVTDNATGASPVGEAVSHSWDAINARYIKINCTRRNTEWGNSIWEMVAYACEAPVVEEVVEAPVEEPVEEPAEEVVEEPAEETVEEVVEEAPAVEEAPQTFDFGVIAAVAAVLSLAGFAVSKKR